jgi:UrcA family protein
MKTSLKLVLATLGCVLAANGALAVESPDTMQTTSVTVRYGDLDLSRSEGAAVLYGRLSNAARKVCAVDESRDLVLYSAARRCYVRALSEALEKVARTTA